MPIIIPEARPPTECWRDHWKKSRNISPWLKVGRFYLVGTIISLLISFHSSATTQLLCVHTQLLYIYRGWSIESSALYDCLAPFFSIWNLALETYNTRAGSSLAHYETSKVKTCLRLKSFESPWLFSRRRWFGNRKVLLLTGLRHWQPFSCLSLVGEKAQWEWEHPSVIIGPAAREVIK
jgi:hypothetical protein